MQAIAKLGLPPGKPLGPDATVIDIWAAVFDWAQFRTAQGAVKPHFLRRKTMLAFDRGDTDYDWSQRLTEDGVRFVIRLRDNPPRQGFKCLGRDRQWRKGTPGSAAL